jgi:hypothetical protein
MTVPFVDGHVNYGPVTRIITSGDSPIFCHCAADPRPHSHYQWDPHEGEAEELAEMAEADESDVSVFDDRIYGPGIVVRRNHAR